MVYAIGTASGATQTYSTSIPTVTNAGTYYVWYKAKGDTNHADSPAKSVPVVIEPYSVPSDNGHFFVQPTVRDGIYDGTEHVVEVSVYPYGATKNKQLVQGVDYEVSGNRGKDPGTYTVTVTCKGNFKGTFQENWSIEPGEIVTYATIPFVPYDGQPHGVSLPVLNNIGQDISGIATIVYGTTPGVYDLTESPTLTEPGIIGVYFKISAPNYYDYTGYTELKVTGKETAPEQPATEQPVMSETEPAPAEVTTEKKTPAFIELSSQFKVTNSGSVVTVKYGRVTGADSYVICAAYCNTSKLMKLGEVNRTKYTFSKLNKKKLDLTRCIKVYVIALQKGKELARTKTAHIALRKHAKYTNVKSLYVSQSSIKLKVGKTKKISTRVILENASKSELPLAEHHSERFTYASNNKAIATVNTKGKIKAVGKGICEIWVYALNGTAKKMRVTVT
jgi:hypothetical protein